MSHATTTTTTTITQGSRGSVAAPVVSHARGRGGPIVAGERRELAAVWGEYPETSGHASLVCGEAGERTSEYCGSSAGLGDGKGLGERRFELIFVLSSIRVVAKADVVGVSSQFSSSAQFGQSGLLGVFCFCFGLLPWLLVVAGCCWLLPGGVPKVAIWNARRRRQSARSVRD